MGLCSCVPAALVRQPSRLRSYGWGTFQQAAQMLWRTAFMAHATPPLLRCTSSLATGMPSVS